MGDFHKKGYPAPLMLHNVVGDTMRLQVPNLVNYNCHPQKVDGSDYMHTTCHRVANKILNTIKKRIKIL